MAKDNKEVHFQDWRFRSATDVKHGHQEWTNGNTIIQWCPKNKAMWIEDHKGNVMKFDGLKEREIKTPPIQKDDMGYIGDSDEEQEEGHKVDSEDEGATGQYEVTEEEGKVKVNVEMPKPKKNAKVVIDLTNDDDEMPATQVLEDT